MALRSLGGVTIYDPRYGQAPALPPARQAPRVPVSRRTESDEERVALTLATIKAVDERRGQQQQEPEGDGGNMFGKGLGILINNPLVRALSRPLDVLQVPQRAVASTINEVADVFNGGDASLQEWYDQINPFHAITQKGDPTFGMGRVTPDVTFDDSLGNFFDKGVGFIGDVATDPFTYLTFGVAPVAGKLARASKLGELQAAQRAAAKLADSNTAFRALGFTDSAIPATVREGAEQARRLGGKAELDRIGQRGLSVSNEAQAKVMDLGPQGARFRIPFTEGRTTGVIPGTAGVGRKVNEAVGALRPIGRAIPGAAALRRSRSPVGFLGDDLHPAYERVITGQGPMSIEKALDVIRLNDLVRQGGGGFGGVAALEVDRLAESLKGMSEDDIRKLRLDAEVLGEKNVLTETAERMVEAARLQGVDLPTLQGGNYAMPHALNRDFHRFLAAGVEAKDDRALDFMQVAGLRTEDLLEGSGFLQRRHFRPMNGQPYPLIIANKKVNILTDSVDELNDKIGALFPEYTGKIYETNPVAAYRQYIQGMSRDVGERAGFARGAQEGIPGLQVKGPKPQRFDPVQTRETAAGVDESFVPGGRTPTGNAAYQMVPDEKATKARNADIVERHTELAEQYKIAGEQGRQQVAEQLDELTNSIIGDARAKQRVAWGEGIEARQRVAQAADDYNELTAIRAELSQGMDEATQEISRLAKVRYNIERTAQSRTAKRQKELLDSIDARMKEVAAERARVTNNYIKLSDDLDSSVQSAADRIRGEARVKREAIEDAPNRKLVEYRNAKASAEKRWRNNPQNRKLPSMVSVRKARDFLERNQGAFVAWVRRREEAIRLIQLRDELRTLREMERQAMTPGSGFRQADEGIMFRLAEREAAGEFDGLDDAIRKIGSELDSPRFKEVEKAVTVLDTRREFDEWVAGDLAVPKGRLVEGRMDADSLAAAQREAIAPRDSAAPEVPEITPQNQARIDAANRLLDTKGAKDLDVEQRILDNLRRQKVDGDEAKAARLNEEIRKQTAKVEALASRTARGKRLDQRVADARATVQRLTPEAPTPPRTPPAPVGHPLVGGVERQIEGLDTKARAEIERLTASQLEGTAEEAAQLRSRMGAIGAGADDEYNRIPLEEGTEAIEKRRLIDDAQERQRIVRTEYQQQADEVDAAIGGTRERYREALQDQEAARAKHEEISRKITGNKPRRATREDPGEGLLPGPYNKSETGRPDLESVRKGLIEPQEAQPLNKVVNEIRQLVDANPAGDDTLLNRAEAALAPLEQQLADLTTQTDIPARAVNDMLGAARRGELGEVLVPMLRDNWREVWENGDVLIHDDLRRHFTHFTKNVTEDPKAFARLLTGYTNFFKTYATLTPGFHVRNAMSAIFMNFTEDVGASVQLRGLKVWRDFATSKSPAQHLTQLAKTNPDEANAIMAALGSGAGGRFFEAGVADATRATGFGKASERIFSNKFTVASQKFGQDWAEGPVRTALALDTMLKKGDVQDAMSRITRIHFDYGQVSEFDETMKRFIPFWTFMSRNLPMQITQMWTKPRVYLRYNHFVNNFSTGENTVGVPDYFDDIGAFQIGEVNGMPLFLQPDFAHTRLQEDVAKLENIAEGDLLRVFSDFNPIYTAPAEFLTKKNFFTGREYQDTDLREAGFLEKPAEWLARGLGFSKETPGGKTVVEERFLDMIYSLNPLFDRARRLAPQAVTGGNDTEMMLRQGESIARTAGVPIRVLTPQQQQRTLQSEQFDMRDQQAMQRALARLDQGD